MLRHSYNTGVLMELGCKVALPSYPVMTGCKPCVQWSLVTPVNYTRTTWNLSKTTKTPGLALKARRVKTSNSNCNNCQLVKKPVSEYGTVLDSLAETANTIIKHNQRFYWEYWLSEVLRSQGTNISMKILDPYFHENSNEVRLSIKVNGVD